MIIMIIIAVFNPTPETSPLITDGGVYHKGYPKMFWSTQPWGRLLYPLYIGKRASMYPPMPGGRFTTHITTH